MPSRPQPPADPATAEALGEMRGQLREIIHNMTNEAQGRQVRDQILAKLADTPDRLAKIEERLTALEIEKNRREGAVGVWAMIIKSPVVAWLVLVAGAVWAAATGRLHP